MWGSRRRALAVLLAGAAAAAVAAATLASAAETPGLPLESTTTTAPEETTTSAPERSSTTTTEAAPLLGPTSSTTTTTTTPPPRKTAPAPPSASPSSGDGGAAAAPTDAGPFPPELQALTNSVRRSRANNTKKLMASLAPLGQFGLSEAQAAIVGFGRFPVAGLASYSHDWWFPRFGPGWRLHEGTDIFAAHGTPVRAPVDGSVRITNGGLGGLAVYVVQRDGTYWYLAHLAATVEGLAEGKAVKTGDVVGFVGDTGNAAGGPPHLHFEIHPGGGGPIDPKPILDQFIADATALAPKVVEAYAKAYQAGTQAKVAPPPVSTPVVPALPPRAALLWTTAVSPTGGALHLAEAEAARAAMRIDWSEREEDGVSAFDRQLARRYARWWVEPLVHPALARHLTVQ